MSFTLEILSILIDLSNCAELLINIYKKYIVWILGSFIVHWSEKRAIDLGIQNLEFDSNILNIYWKGIRGMKWVYTIPSKYIS